MKKKKKSRFLIKSKRSVKDHQGTQEKKFKNKIEYLGSKTFINDFSLRRSKSERLSLRKTLKQAKDIKNLHMMERLLKKIGRKSGLDLKKLKNDIRQWSQIQRTGDMLMATYHGKELRDLKTRRGSQLLDMSRTQVEVDKKMINKNLLDNKIKIDDPKLKRFLKDYFYPNTVERIHTFEKFCFSSLEKFKNPELRINLRKLRNEEADPTCTTSELWSQNDRQTMLSLTKYQNDKKKLKRFSYLNSFYHIDIVKGKRKTDYGKLLENDVRKRFKKWNKRRKSRLEKKEASGLFERKERFLNIPKKKSFNNWGGNDDEEIDDSDNQEGSKDIVIRYPEGDSGKKFFFGFGTGKEKFEIDGEESSLSPMKKRMLKLKSKKRKEIEEKKKKEKLLKKKKMKIKRERIKKRNELRKKKELLKYDGHKKVLERISKHMFFKNPSLESMRLLREPEHYMANKRKSRVKELLKIQNRMEELDRIDAKEEKERAEKDLDFGKLFKKSLTQGKKKEKTIESLRKKLSNEGLGSLFDHLGTTKESNTLLKGFLNKFSYL